MAIQLNQTDIHLTSVVSNFPNTILPMSLSCWVSSTEWNSGNAISMVGVYLPGTTAVQIGTRGSNNIDVWTWGGGELVSSNAAYLPVSGELINVIYTWDGVTHKLYIDGNFIVSSTSTNIAGVLTTIYINGFPTGGIAETSSACVDDVSYYDRALSADEVKTVYLMRGYKDSIFSGLIARYCFNELTPGENVTSVVDYSGNNNLLTTAGPGTLPTYIVGSIDLDERPVLG